MKSRVTAAAAKAAMDAAESLRDYQLTFVAMLGRAAGVLPDDLIVVGGSAIELYTGGAYTSGDVDLVSSASATLRQVLKEWGFVEGGRLLVKADWKLYVDLVRFPYTGSFEHTTVAASPAGAVRIAAPEDLLVKRLMSAKFWKQPDDLRHAELLAESLGPELDWTYIANFAAKEDVLDLANAVKAKAERRR